MTYTFYEDPGHGWLEVPMAELVELGIADKITPCSYRDGDKAYLEEDLDMATFLEAKAGPPIDGSYAHWHKLYRTDYSATLRGAPEIWIRWLPNYYYTPAPMIGMADITRQMVFDLAGSES